jgi:hypothetical protein
MDLSSVSSLVCVGSASIFPVRKVARRSGYQDAWKCPGVRLGQPEALGANSQVSIEGNHKFRGPPHLATGKARDPASSATGFPAFAVRHHIGNERSALDHKLTDTRRGCWPDNKQDFAWMRSCCRCGLAGNA